MQYPDPRQFGIEERDVKLRQRIEEIVSNPFAWVGWISGWGIAFGVLAALFGQPGDVELANMLIGGGIAGFFLAIVAGAAVHLAVMRPLLGLWPRFRAVERYSEAKAEFELSQLKASRNLGTADYAGHGALAALQDMNEHDDDGGDGE